MNTKELFSPPEFIPLRKGKLASKETFRKGEEVFSVIDVGKLSPQDRDPEKIFYFVSAYIDRLNIAGVPIIPIKEIERLGNLVIIHTKYFPCFLDEALASGRVTLEGAITAILVGVERASAYHLGIDPTPKNFAVDGYQILYGDFFYPFVPEYIEWSRKRMDSTCSQNAYILFSQDSMFFPLVCAHAVSDFLDLRLFDPQNVTEQFHKLCREKWPELDFYKELEFYKREKQKVSYY
jgi:hypothetical protein